MISLSPKAAAQVAALEQFYIIKHRPQAMRNLAHALAEASLIIANAPERGLQAPRAYPGLARLELAWLKRGQYWIAYDPAVPVIAGASFETDDIPSRV